MTLAASYYAVIDAGSSGSRIYLYDKKHATNSISVRTLFFYEPEQIAALSSFSEKPEQAGPKGIAPLLDRLSGVLQEKGISKNDIQLDLLATAGMRLLSDDIASRIYSSVRESMIAADYKPNQIRTITGQDEGLFSWADVNYLAGTFDQGRTSVGLVEVGGASAQVVFEADRSTLPLRTVQVFGKSYTVVALSYLGLGQNQARYAMLKSPFAKNTGGFVCYPHSTDSSMVFKTGITKIPGPEGNYGSDCLQAYKDVIRNTASKPENLNARFERIRESAGFDQKQFIAISSTYFVARDWGVLDQGDIRAGFFNTQASYCSGQNAWSRISQKLGTKSFAQNACANTTFIYALLFSSEGLDFESSRVTVTNNIDGHGLTWTRGFVLLN